MRQPSGMIVLKDQKTRRQIRKYRTVEPGNNAWGWDGKVSYDAGSEILTYEVALDMHAISCMALKAGGNRTGRAKSGPVTVVITQREPVPQTPFRGEAPDPPSPVVKTIDTLYNEGRRILAGLDEGKETKQ